ncbi:amino acid adenylation domain-containing protein [Streptomyces sp. WMMB 322]|uniref:amino acid adenylation domain-containing protein n=1 Tax=Streptomyces sp. WMMB 322 TaxID=1286821 RepID=UPI0008239BC2|nr:amino acid adenylation domain-containing protein [Streptomyces sp. WMMB 322]SCK38965.1 amino acid adenylation domain-containing protein [Streptomyces sp. WMMB 322]
MHHAEHEAAHGRAGAPDRWDARTPAAGGGGPDETVWGLFEARASRQGSRIAVVDGTVDIDYERLRARAEAIAGELAARGVAPGALVGVCLGRTWELVATLLGVLRAGCAYVPMDPAYPAERVRYMIEHSRAASVVVDAGTAALCSAAPDRVRLDAVPDRPAASPAACSAADLAYVIYTSGSTGKPKGVAVEHRSVVAMTASMRELLGDEDLAGVLAAASVCFDPSVMEILGTLVLGGTVVLSENVLALRELPAAHRVRTAIMVPSAMQALLATGPLPGGLRCVVLGGEVLSRSLLERLHTDPCAPRVVNVYGPTEATVFVTAVEAGSGPITIGSPVLNTRAYVLDESLQPVPAGTAGELALAGDQLARGYLHDDERTRHSFPAPAPDGPIPEQRIYRTGDLCRWTETGELEFLGRADRQVKIRGHRIELDEIEAVLASMPGVDEAAVVATTGEGKSFLTAYAVSRQESVTASTVRSRLADRLPKYMIPHHVMLPSEIPKLPNGKVDRLRLPTPVHHGDEAAAQDKAAPQEKAGGDGPAASRTGPGALPSPHGQQRSVLLARVLEETALLLGAPGPDAVRPDEPLAALGFDSLDIAELTVRLSRGLATDLPSSTLVEQMTPKEAVEGLLAVLGRASGGGEVRARPQGVGAADRLDVFQEQVRSGHPPAFAAKVPAWSATDRGALVQHFRRLLARSGLDPYGKVVRTGSAERGVVADPGTGEEHEALIWTTNLYLGLNRDEEVIEEARSALGRFGTGMGISAAGSGQTGLHTEFEQEFAAMVGKPAACLFPTGFTASLGAVAGIVGDQDVVVMDQLCHASLVDGARLSGARVRTFRHNDATDLRAILEAETSPYRTTLVVLESVYSMGEGAAPLREIVSAAKESGALVLVDEAHSFGLYGVRGAGLCAAEGVTEDVDFVLTTLSKALGSIGGVVAAREQHIDLLRASARSYVFQANISPADVAAALAALRRVAAGDALRARLWDTAHYMRKRFSDAGYELGTGEGLIITPFFSDGEKLHATARGLFRRGVHAAAVTYPIVERGRGRLRFICSASHTRADVDETLQALIEAEKEAAAFPTSPDAMDLRKERDEESTRFDVTNWADAFTTYLESNLAELPAPAPHLVVTIVLPGGQEDLVVRINEHGVTREPDNTAAMPACSLRLVDDEATAALCSRNVESLLGSVIAGSCVLAGHTQPFVWLIGRLSDWQSSTSGA